jgi:hypothetical protein
MKIINGLVGGLTVLLTVFFTNVRRGVAFALVVLAIHLLAPCKAQANPRSPLPQMPEISWPLFHETFDEVYEMYPYIATNAQVTVGNFTLVESWSGYALQRSGDSVTPFYVPAADLGHTNVNCSQGTIRFWFEPTTWSSMTQTNGAGLGAVATLLELDAIGKNESANLWTLAVSSDGNTLSLVAQSDDIPALLLQTEISWQANQSHLIAMDYSPNETALFIDGQLVAQGAGTLSVPPQLAGLFVGSSLGGKSIAGGDFDELFCFEAPPITRFYHPLTTMDLLFYYNVYAPNAALGPISAEEIAARAEMIAARKAQRASALSALSLDSGGMEATAVRGTYGPLDASACVTNVPIYMTNVYAGFETDGTMTVTFDIVGGTNGLNYDVLGTTNLASGQWFWVTNTPTCNTVVITNQAVTQTFYILRSTQDSDGSGFPDWWQLQYFGYLGVDPYGNPASDGYSNLQKFQLDMNPNQFYTPPAPIPFNAFLNSDGATATLTWNPPPGPVQQYNIQRSDPGQFGNYGSFNPIGTAYAPQTSFQDNQSPVYQDPESYLYSPDFVLHNSVYRLQAIYAHGPSHTIDTMLNGGDSSIGLDAKLIRNSNGHWELVCPFVPAHVTKLRLNWFAWDYYLGSEYFLSSEDVPVTSLTAGVYVIPDAEIITRVYVIDPQNPQNGPVPDEAQELWVRGVDAFGDVGQAVSAGFVYQDAPCLVDGRQHLKQNMLFKLRAATLSKPCIISDSATAIPADTNSVESSFFHQSVQNMGFNYGTDYIQLNDLWPFDANYRLHNRLFDTNYTGPGSFQWQTNFDTMPAPPILATNSAYPYWISQDPYNLSDIALTLSTNSLNSVLGMQSGKSNLFGLALNTSLLQSAVNNNTGLFVPVALPAAIPPGTSLIIDTNYFGTNYYGATVGSIYSQAAAPNLQSVGYYFAPVLTPGTELQSYYPTAEDQPNPLPVNLGFSYTNQTPVLVASVGEQVVIGGWQKFQLSNGNANKYAYLGQYFTNALQLDASGNTTSTNAGILSPYGEFFPTRPGPAALVTMSDIDTGQRGTGIVQVISLNADGNHDGTLDFNYFGPDQTTPSHPYRFWVNDNKDDGDDGGDGIPNQGTHADTIPGLFLDYVQGSRDLVDFFPVHVSIRSVLKAIPSITNLQFVLKQADGALYYLETDLTPTNYMDYLRTTNFLQFLGYNSLCTLIQPGGVGLSTNFLTKIRDQGEGIILVEASKATSQPLILEVWQDTKLLAQTSLYLSVTEVEQMFRHKNLMPNINSTNLGAMPDRLTDMSVTNEPDTNGKNFVFLHGYNVNPNQARGWFADLFKRMYWSGSRAKFYGVTWQGADSQIADAVTINLQTNIIHAFVTASNLTTFLATLTNGTVVAAHSLGNMVVLSALNDYQVTNISKFFMIDAAVAVEAIQGNAVPDVNLIYPDWVSYANRLYASDWWSLFPTNDARSTLTWNNRLANSGNTDVYNFYSSGEEVLREYTGGYPPSELTGSAAEVRYYLVTAELNAGLPSGAYTWAWQEMLKGRGQSDELLSSTHGGWKFNLTAPYLYNSNGLPAHMTPTQAAAVPNSELQTNAFFDVTSSTFGTADTALFGSSGSAYAQANRNRILSDSIPCLTLPAGANPIPKFSPPLSSVERNFNMQNLENNWPASRMQNPTELNNWHHSDCRQVSYTFTHKLFDNIVTLGELQ